MTQNVAKSNAASVSIPVEKMGPPGVVTHLHVVPVFENQTRSDEEKLKDITPRKFFITARLAKNNDIQPTITFNFDKGSGDSLFAIPDSAVYLKVETHDGKFFFFPNIDNRLSSIQFECIAHSNTEARQLFHKVVGPSLDHLAYIGNTPLHVVQTTIVDEMHHISSTDILCPHPVVALHPGVGKVPAKLAPVFAMYREAVNATSPFYKFFCLYKILEGLLKTLRGNLYKEAREKGVSLPLFQVKVPYYSDISDDQKPYVGKSITKFFDDVLTNRFRNSMAHFISDEGVVLNVNEMDGIERYAAVVHIADLCCREVILHFEACIAALEKPST